MSAQNHHNHHSIHITPKNTKSSFSVTLSNLKYYASRLSMPALLQKLNPKKDAQKKASSEAAFRKTLNRTVTKVAKITGWSPKEVEAKFWQAHNHVKCSPSEYFRYRLYNLTPQEQETYYYSFNQAILQKKYGTDKEFVSIICDKERTNLYFSDYVRRPWCVNNRVSFEQFCDIFRNSSRVIYKPSGGHCGYGIEAFDLNDQTRQAVYNKLITYPQGVVEEYICQHPDMQRLSPSSVNSLRFVTVSSFTKSKNREPFVDIVYSIVRIGRGDSVVDNLHSGGMVANADLETGILVTGGADHTSTLYAVHPETGTPIKGFKIPYFFETLELVKEAIEKNRVEGYLGWDWAIGENGPLLMEVNARPGADGLQTAYALEGKGMKHVMEKYL